MLVDKLREDLLVARRSRNAVSIGLLTALVGEVVMVGKNFGNRETTDTETIAIIRKFLKNAEENAVRLASVNRSINETNIEISILRSYLPQQMSDVQLNTAITNIKQSNPNFDIGQIMRVLKDKYNGCYDSKHASEIIKAILKEK